MFPEEVQRFLLENINAVEQLEVLLLLRADPGKEWTAADVGQGIYTSPAAAVMRLQDLAGRGLLAVAAGPDPRYRYRPADSARARLVDLVAETYRERRVAVITLIYSRPSDRVQAFADAFRLRKDP